MIAKADGVRQTVDRVLRPRKKMPVGRRLGLAVGADVVLFFRGSHPRRVARVETHRQHAEILAHRELRLPQAFDQAVEHLGAQHRAAKVGHHQNHRLLAEVVAHLHLVPGFVAKRDVERDRLVEPLIEADAF